MNDQASPGIYRFLRPMLFRLDPEAAHALTLRLLRSVGSWDLLAKWVRSWYAVPSEPVKAFGLTFPNWVGLAAGYDKDGTGWRGLACLGFGHIEMGTVTLQPQAGNPRPRLYRLVEDRALINRMGFPGVGADSVSQALQSRRSTDLILGVNLGKNKDTPLEDAARDYQELLVRFAPLADYLAINVSSPNTVGLRRLQARQALEDLLGVLIPQRDRLAGELSRSIPLLVKLAPDLEDAELEDALGAMLGAGVDGVIATNTTLQRGGLNSPYRTETGGLSGAPLRSASTGMVKKIVSLTAGKLPVIAVGGVMDAGDAREKLDAGAVLVQVYTGLVYAGPRLVKDILTGLKDGN